MNAADWNTWLGHIQDLNWHNFTEDQQYHMVASSEQNASDVPESEQLECMKETLRQYRGGELEDPTPQY